MTFPSHVKEVLALIVKNFVHHFELSVETVYTEECILRNLAQYLWRQRKWILRKKSMSWLLINETVQKVVRNVA